MELIAELKKWAKIRQLKAQVKIRQLKELKMLDILRLSIEVLIEVLPEVLIDIAIEVFAKILTAEVLIKLASGTELI